MKKQKVTSTIKYDGLALNGKAIDIADLAPSLLALSDLLKAANKQGNGDRAGVKVLVNADLEQKCFELNIELALTIWDQAKLLIADDEIQSAKELAEWVGICTGGCFGLFQLIKWIKGKEIESVSLVKSKDGKDMIEIRADADPASIQISKSVFELYANQTTRQKALSVLSPLHKEGYESLEFYAKKNIFLHFKKQDMPAPDGSNLPEVMPENVRKSMIRTGVKIRKPAYEGKSRWTVVYHRPIEAVFKDEAWLRAFQNAEEHTPPGSYLEVDLEEEYTVNADGEIVGNPSYIIKKVHSVTAPPEQRGLNLIRNDDSGHS